MIQEYKSFLRIQNVSWNEDLDKEKFEVKYIAWLNFGYGERIDDNGQFQLVFHPKVHSWDLIWMLDNNHEKFSL